MSAILTTLFLHDVAAEILVIHDLAEPVAHLVGVELDALLGQLREIEQHVLEQRGHDGVEPPGADVLHARSEERRVGKSVDLGGRRIIKKKKIRIKKLAKQRRTNERACISDIHTETQVRG